MNFFLEFMLLLKISVEEKQKVLKHLIPLNTLPRQGVRGYNLFSNEVLFLTFPCCQIRKLRLL